MGRKKKGVLDDDTREQINQCLACKLPECVNCISYGTQGRASHRVFSAVVLTDRAGKVLAYFRSRRKAVELTGITPATLSRAVCYGIFWRGGYLWRDANRVTDAAIPCLRCEKAECDNCQGWDYQPPELHLHSSVKSPAVKAHGSPGRPVLQLDDAGNVLREFETVRKAAASVFTEGTLISRAARLNVKACGFYWKYKEA